MKKLSVLLVAAIMVLALTMPAAAFENEFGGYWRTRFITDTGFSGSSRNQTQDTNLTDTRTRLYYTAKFSDNLKFVNKFEINASWGGNGTYGQVGADATDAFRIKNSYVDFKLGQQRFNVGVQGFELARGYLFNDDAAGIKAIFKVNDAVYLPFIYMKLYEGTKGYINGKSASDYDMAAYVFYPTIYLNKDNTLKPHVAYLTSENASLAKGKGLPLAPPGVTNVDLWTAGLEYDGKIGIFDLGATGIFQFGDAKTPNGFLGNGKDKLNYKGYLFDLFGGVNLGPANIHLKGIYASGNEKNDLKNGDMNAFVNPGVKDNIGASYYWAEIMGDGIIDNQTPIGAPGDKISNLWVGNVGASYKVLPTLKFSADIWYAKHANEVQIASATVDNKYSSDLGTELDLVASYTIVDNLKLDLIGAYLWAGDAITKNLATNDPNGNVNPYELAAMLSLAF
jgi:hypothetical protein